MSDPLDELDEEEKEILADYAKKTKEGAISRRGALGALAGLGIGGAAGALGTQTVSASDHNDSEGNVGLPGDRVDLFADSADVKEQPHTQPTGTYDWQDIQWIRRQGGVVASNGKVYQGASAVQDAIDGVGIGGTVLVGADTYDPITISKRDINVHGLGVASKIASTSADTHTVTLNDPSSAHLRRIRMSDLSLRTLNASGASDCLHIETVNGNIIYESWFNRLSLGGGPRHGIYLEGSSNSTIQGIYANNIHAEGFGDRAVVANQHTNQMKLSGDFSQQPDDHVFDLDGSGMMLFAWDASHMGGTTTSQLRFGSNSSQNLAFIADGGYAPPIDNGTKNYYWFPEYQGGSGFAHGNISNDGMTANPETDTEDAYLRYWINGTQYEIPLYQG